MSSDVELIKSRLNIIDVVSDYVKLIHTGTSWKGLCPFHNEKSPSFNVNQERQMFYCFGCNKGGDVFSFVSEMENLEFREVLVLLADRAGVTLSHLSSHTQASSALQKNSVREILDLATRFYEKQLWDSSSGKAALSYLRDRGLTDVIIKKFRLGYAPRGWRHIFDFLSSRSFTREDILRTGLCISKIDSGRQTIYDRFRDRIIFPIADVSGLIVGHTARIMPGSDTDSAKYINTPETEVYHKSSILYGISFAKQSIKNNKKVLLVEGNMDVIAAHLAGLDFTVAVSGTSLTIQHLTILKRYTDTVYLYFDMDLAGEAALSRSVKLCFSLGLTVFIVRVPGGKDASELLQYHPGDLQNALESACDAFLYYFDSSFSQSDISTASGKQKVLDDLLPILAYIVNPVSRAHWVSKIALRLGVPESVVLDSLSLQRIDSFHSSDRLPDLQKVKSSVILRSRRELLLEHVCGFMLIDKTVWQKIGDVYSKDVDFYNHSLFSFLCNIGPSVSCDFNTVLTRPLKSDIDAALLQRIFFEVDSWLHTQNDYGDLYVLTESYLRLARDEIKKEKLLSLSRDLSAAEMRGDIPAQQMIMDEFNRLSRL